MAKGATTRRRKRQSEASRCAKLAKQKEFRARETSQQREARLQSLRENYARRKRAGEVPEEQCNVERTIAKERMAQAELNETMEARRSSRLTKDTQHQVQARENKTETKYLVNSALVTISRMVKETATQRIRRLKKQKQKRREKLLQESEAGKSARLARRRKQEQEIRARETSPDREARLRQQRAAYAQRVDKKCDAEIEDLYKIIQHSGPRNKIHPATTPSPNITQHQGGAPRTTELPYNFATRQLSTRNVKLRNQISMYHQKCTEIISAQQNLLHNMKYPIHPDVEFKRLPFFDILSELVKPSTLIPQNKSQRQECSFCFYLTPQQVKDIESSRDLQLDSCAECIKQIHMRFCLMDTSFKHDDCFPPDVVVKVNNTKFALPNPINKPDVEPKRAAKPVNITQFIELSPTTPNTIHVSWADDYNKAYVISVALVHKRYPTDLLQRMKTRGPKHSEHTREIIKQKLNEDADSEIATTSLRVSLTCPLGKMRMANPCRAKTCEHLQCFDAFFYLRMNERKSTWNCPVCNKPALYEDLEIDGYFEDVLCSPQLNSDISEIQLHKDGSWSIYIETKKPLRTMVLKVNTTDDTVEIISDDIAKT